MRSTIQKFLSSSVLLWQGGALTLPGLGWMTASLDSPISIDKRKRPPGMVSNATPRLARDAPSAPRSQLSNRRPGAFCKEVRVRGLGEPPLKWHNGAPTLSSSNSVLPDRFRERSQRLLRPHPISLLRGSAKKRSISVGKTSDISSLRVPANASYVGAELKCGAADRSSMAPPRQVVTCLIGAMGPLWGLSSHTGSAPNDAKSFRL